MRQQSWSWVRRNAASAGIIAFVLTSVLILIADGATHIFGGVAAGMDGAILRQLRLLTGGHSPMLDALRQAALGITFLGNDATLVIITAVAATYLLARRKRAEVMFLIGATATGGILTTVLKLAFHRQRPDVVTHLVATSTASFPSGHAMNSAFVYFIIAAIASRSEAFRASHRYLLGGASVLIFLIGTSRLYLGVHWPTDVLAGWFLGTAWAVFALSAATRYGWISTCGNCSGCVGSASDAQTQANRED